MCVYFWCDGRGTSGKKDSATLSDSLLSDIEPLIEKAVAAAMNVLREEFA